MKVVWALITAVLAAAVAIFPLLFVVALALLVPLVLRYPTGRLAWLLFGGLLVLQSSQGLNAPKLAYFAGVVVAVIASYNGMRRALKSPWGATFRPVLHGCVVLAGVVTLASMVGYASGATSALDIARDGLTYLLILPAVIIGLDAARSATPTAVDRLVIVVSLTAAIGFAIAWLGRRGATEFELNQALLASIMLLAPGVALGIVRGTSTDRRRLPWLAFSGLLIGSVLVTGARSGLVLAAAVVGVLGSTSKGRASLWRVLPAVITIGATIVGALYVASTYLGLGAFLAQRLAVAQQALTSGWAVDNSGTARLAARSIALAIWSENKLLGVGLGQPFPNPEGGLRPVYFQIDTPFLYLAKFGIMGTLFVVMALVLLTQPAFRATIGGHRRWVPEQAVMRGVVAVWLVTLIFGAVTEDKGFALSMALLVLLTGANLRAACQDINGPNDPEPSAGPPAGAMQAHSSPKRQ